VSTPRASGSAASRPNRMILAAICAFSPDVVAGCFAAHGMPEMARLMA
jgi:hypothetical protein